MRSGSRWVLPVTVGLVALVAKILLSAPLLTSQAALVAITWLVTLSFAAVGLSLLATDVPSANGWACLLMACSTVPGDLNSTSYLSSGWTAVGFVLEPVYLPAGVALALRYPASRLSAPNRLLVWSLAAVTSPVRLVTVLTAGPLPDGYYRPVTAAAWWSPFLHDAVFVRAGRGAAALLLVGASVALVRRAALARGVSRESVIPLTVIGAVTALAAAVDQGIWAVNAFREVPADLVRDLSAALVPVALLGDLLRRRSAVATISQRVLRAARSGDLERTQAALQLALRDPQLRVLPPECLAEDGPPPADHPALTSASSGICEYTVRGDDGRVLARLWLDPRVADDEELVTAAVEATGTGLENARLTSDLRRRNVELRESRARIVAAGVEQRRQIERDLHDGAQQGFLAVSATLGRAQLVDPQQLGPLVDEARTGLSAALGELRRLARGIHPAALSQGGLLAAVPALCAPFAGRTTLVMAPAVGACAHEPAIETTAYFVVAEALTNAARYAPDASVAVHLDIVDGVLRIEVSDDGPGGAHLAPGGGLSGLADRVAALGGELGVDSRDASGTRLRAKLPLHNRAVPSHGSEPS